jgi:hypothetical protein
MIEVTLGLIARTTGRAGRRLPLAGRLFGREPRLELEGRVVFVTGAARGLGAEPRRSMASESRIVLLPTRSSTTSSRFASAIRAESRAPCGSTRSAPSAMSAAKRRRLRVVAMTRTQASTARLSAARPKEDVAPRMTSVCRGCISRLRSRHVKATA